MRMIELTRLELAAVVAASAGLAVTDGAAISRLAVAYLAVKLGLDPETIVQVSQATDE